MLSKETLQNSGIEAPNSLEKELIYGFLNHQQAVKGAVSSNVSNFQQVILVAPSLWQLKLHGDVYHGSSAGIYSCY